MTIRRTLAHVLLLVSVGACREDAVAPRGAPEPSRPGAVVEVTITGIGTRDVRASAAHVPGSPGGPRYALSGLGDTDGGGDGSIQLEPLFTESFTVGERGSGGYRYLNATFRVRNAQEDGSEYDTQRQNLTFFAVSSPVALGATAIVSMRRFSGSAADPSIAPHLLPTGLVSPAPFTGVPTPGSPDVIQVISESEADAVSAPEGVDVLPYGFTVRNAAGGGRTLAATPAAGQYDGRVTFAFRVPLQASTADDPYSVTIGFLAQDDSETRITQSLEEQTPAGEAAFLARATQIGATMKTVLPGIGSYSGDGARTVCSVRTAGTSGSPTAYLVDRSVSTVTLTDPFAAFPLSPDASVIRRLQYDARDGAGDPMADIPVQLAFGTPGVLTLRERGMVRMIPRYDRASTTVTAAACGVAATPTVIRTSGFIPLAGGHFHTLAVRSDVRVAAWGDNAAGQTTLPPFPPSVVQVSAGMEHSLSLRPDGTMGAWGEALSGFPLFVPGFIQIAAGSDHGLALRAVGTVAAWGVNGAGQLNVPAGLTGVVQVAAGEYHSLALRSDGTVVAWGFNNFGEANVPAGLSDVVQVSAGGNHSLALRSDGTVVGWGLNSSGQRTIPAGLAGVVQVVAGSVYSLALRSDGTVAAWGNNGMGQLNVPPGLVAVYIASGAGHSLALDAAGTVTGWGWNGFAQITTPPGLVAAVP